MRMMQSSAGTLAASEHGRSLHGGAHDFFMGALEWVVLGINAVTVVVLVWGVVCGARKFIAIETKRMSGGDWERERDSIRRLVGFYLLFGLELLIAADVIETMIRPTLDQLAILGGVSLIRIITGFALGREIKELSEAPTNG